MKRLHWLSAAIGGAFIAGLAFSGAMAAEPIVLKFSAPVPSGGGAFTGSIKPWLEDLEKASEGTIKFDIYADGKLAKAGETFNAVEGGVADVGWGLPLSYGARFQELNVVTVPGLFSDGAVASESMYKLWQDGLIHGFPDTLIVLAFYSNPPLAIMTKNALKSPSDLAGNKIQIAGKLRAQMVEALGGQPVSLAYAETYSAMQKGVVDGTYTSFQAANGNKFVELMDYYVKGPFGGGCVGIVINKAVFEKLPAKAQKAFVDAAEGGKSSRWYSNNAKNAEDAIEKGLREDPKKTVVELEGADLKAVKDAAAGITEEWAKSFEGGDKVLAKFKEYVAGR